MSNAEIPELEEWREIEGHPSYEVSSHGQIRNRNTGRIKTVPASSLNGYKVIKIYDRHAWKKKVTIKIHVAVARAFLGERPEGQQINHKDQNKENNRADNLEYTTQSDNIKQNFLKTNRVRGSEIPCVRKVYPALKALVLQLRANGGSLRGVAAKTGLSTAHVSRITNGKY